MVINKELLLKISSISRPSGYEGWLYDEIVKYSKKNLVNFKPHIVSNELYLVKSSKSKNGKNIMFDAHSDQVSLRVYRIDSDGFLYARAFGMSNEDIYGKEVTVLNRGNPVRGVINIVPPHFDEYNDSNVIIDIFVDSRAEAEKLVQIGNPAILNTQPPKIAKNKIVGAGLDNSVSVYACLEMAKQLDKVPIDNNIIIHFSRREETGGLKFINMMRDVSEIPNKIDYIFVVDTEIATDVPALQLDEMTEIRINLGPVISRNLVDDTMLSYQCQDLADKNKIKYQLVMSSMPGAANNLGNYNAMNSIGQSIGIPLRNMHSGVEVVSLGDIERTIDLIIVLAKELL